MRISDRMVSQNYLSYLNTNKSAVEDLKEKISTSQKIRKPSDSPSGMSKVLNLQKSLKQNNTYKNNIEDSIAYLQSSINAMESIQTEVQRILTQFADMNDASETGFGKMFADKLGASIDSIVGLANEQFDGKYIFGGTDSSQKPYQYNADKSAVEQKVPDTSGEQKVRIRKNTVIKINVTGKEIFGDIDGGDIFNTLLQIKESIRNGENPDNALKDKVTKFNDDLLNKLSDAGNRINRMYDTKDQIDNQNLSIKDLIANENEVDIAKAIMDLQSQEYVLQVSYKLSSMINHNTLMDYL